MIKCENCGNSGELADMRIDHILPRSHPDYNALSNLRRVHLECNKPLTWWQKLNRWLGRLRWRLQMFADKLRQSK